MSEDEEPAKPKRRYGEPIPKPRPPEPPKAKPDSRARKGYPTKGGLKPHVWADDPINGKSCMNCGVAPSSLAKWCRVFDVVKSRIEVIEDIKRSLDEATEDVLTDSAYSSVKKIKRDFAVDYGRTPDFGVADGVYAPKAAPGRYEEFIRKELNKLSASKVYKTATIFDEAITIDLTPPTGIAYPEHLKLCYARIEGMRSTRKFMRIYGFKGGIGPTKGQEINPQSYLEISAFDRIEIRASGTR